MQAGLVISSYLFLPKQTDGQIYTRSTQRCFRFTLRSTHTQTHIATASPYPLRPPPPPPVTYTGKTYPQEP